MKQFLTIAIGMCIMVTSFTALTGCGNKDAADSGAAGTEETTIAEEAVEAETAVDEGSDTAKEVPDESLEGSEEESLAEDADASGEGEASLEDALSDEVSQDGADIPLDGGTPADEAADSAEAGSAQ